MKKLLSTFVAALILIGLASCSGSKEIPYMQNIDTISLAPSKGLYDAKIMPKDLLTITVSTTDADAARPFNLTVQGTLGAGGDASSNSGSMQQYLVDNNGDIKFPVIGKIHVVGLTKTQCEDLITQKISPYMAAQEHPVVTVRMASYHVTVIGEVGSPKVVPVTTEKMNIFEALASAGDLGIYGKRNNIILLREDSTGQKSFTRLDLTDANVINSPYYYLQQNDIIYVEPNKVKAQNTSIGSSTTLWFSLVGIVTSVASLVINIVR